jgi:hypothetical protein
MELDESAAEQTTRREVTVALKLNKRQRHDQEEQQRILTLQKTQQRGRVQEEERQQDTPLQAVEYMPLKHNRCVCQHRYVKKTP